MVYKLDPSSGEHLSFAGQEIDEQQLGLQAPVDNELISSPEATLAFVVPSPEETTAIYERVVHQRNLSIPEGMDLGLVLARIPPERQSLFRAIHGMFPFTHKYPHTELAELRCVDTSVVYSMASRTYKAVKDGIETYQKDNPRTGISLETLGRAVLKNTHNLSPYEIDLLKKINGLPPYLIPIGPSDIADGESVSRSAITLRERTAARRLLGHMPTQAAQTKMNKPKKLAPSSAVDAGQRRKLLRARDAGWYAGILHSLHGEESREYWADTIYRDLGRAALIREGMRKRRQSNPRPLDSALSRTALVGQKPANVSTLIEARRAFNPAYDMPDGQRQIVAELIARADTLDAADLSDLEIIMEEGVQAQAQLLEDNITLVFFMANKLNLYDKGGQFNAPDLSAGYRGLREAVQRFDDSLGFTFSTYAAKMIAGRILQERTKYTAAKLGVSVPVLRDIRKARRAEADLYQELQRAPTPAEIIEKAGLVGTKAIEIIQRATKYTAVISFDKVNDKGSSLDNTMGSVDPNIERIEFSDSLADTFREVFDESDLSDAERRVLTGMFGITTDEKTEHELAQELGLSSSEVLKLFRHAKNKIATSPGARKLLRGYVEQV